MQMRVVALATMRDVGLLATLETFLLRVARRKLDTKLFMSRLVVVLCKRLVPVHRILVAACIGFRPVTLVLEPHRGGYVSCTPAQPELWFWPLFYT